MVEHAHGAVHPASLPVVGEHHHAHAVTQSQPFGRGRQLRVPFAFTYGHAHMLGSGKVFQVTRVDDGCRPVHAGQDDALPRRPDPPVQLVQAGLRDRPVPQRVEQSDELPVMLPVGHGQAMTGEPDIPPFEHGSHRVRLEEPWSRPDRTERVHVVAGDDGRQLQEVADQDQAHAAEREPTGASGFQERVETVHEVGAHHADLVDDQRVDQTVERVPTVPSAGLARLFDAHAGTRMQERVDGLPVHVQGGDARGREHDDITVGT